MSYLSPELIEENGQMCFQFANGVKSKTFHSAGKFNWVIGEFPIYDENNNVVEYMDLLGHFTKQPTEFAYHIYRYMISVKNAPFRVYGNLSLLNFPSKYLIDDEIIKVVKDFEETKYQNLCVQGYFNSLISRLRYKLYIKFCIKEKLNQAHKLKENEKIASEIKELFI